MKPIIKVEGVSKRYDIGGARVTHDTLRDHLTYSARTALDRIGRIASNPRAENRATGKKSFWALRDVSFNVSPGEVVGIVGKNGAGKSTLLKVLSRIVEPTEGRAELYGRVGSLLEVGTGFHPELSGRENVFLNGAILGMKRTEIVAKFDEIVGFAEVEKFLDAPVKHYSSGMYTRLAFAVAAHLEPEILIVDEVLAVGDATFQKKCLGKMSDVARLGRTVLFVSHNMAAVSSLCSRAILLQEGRVTEEGAPAHIVNKYLSSESVSRAQVVWDQETGSAPGNEMFRLHAIRVRDVRGDINPIINSHESIDIEIEYINLRSGIKLGTTILLYNQEGVAVFSSLSNNDPHWHGRSRPEGMFRSTVRIPSHLLPEGRFVVTVLLWSDNYTFAHREDNTVEFEVRDTGESRGDYFGGWVGVVRPQLQWHAKFVDEEEARRSKPKYDVA